jgi:hypothetical protein
LSSKYTFLGHKYNPFNKPNISNTAKEYGFQHRDAVEAHLWVYELYYQIQKRAGTNCLLKGGACAQLYLPLQVQRCTLDLDVATSLTARDLQQLLKAITSDFNANRFHSEFREYIPRQPLSDKQLIPMKTFLFTLPFIFKRGRRGSFPDIKMDFIFLPPEDFPATYVEKGKTVGLELKYSPFTLTQYSIICNKFLIFASSSIGLDTYKIESFYKNIYDLYYLTNEYNNLNCFKEVSKIIDNNIRLEFSLKNQMPSDTLSVIDDMLSTLHELFTLDLLSGEPKPPKRLVDFQERCIQVSIRQDLNLDTWAIMAMYLYIWLVTLREYINSGSSSSIELINYILDEYDKYVTLDKKERRSLIKEYKKTIFFKDSRLMLSRGIDPLRIIYLYNIYNRLF